MPLLGDAVMCEIPEFSQREIPVQIKFQNLVLLTSRSKFNTGLVIGK
jgi:hypothetical protein